MTDSNDAFPLATLQKWMQAFLVRPVDPELQEQHGTISPQDIETLIAPSKRMNARQRLAIYQRGYFARLQECMSKQFSVLKFALGEDLFRDFAYEYLQGYPSASYTLGDLGARFPDFLESTRPDKDAAPEDRESWPDFMIELARLEWACFKLMECDTAIKGAAIRKNQDDPVLFYLPPAFELFSLQFPSYAYYRAVIKGQTPEFPSPAPNYLLLANRHDRIGAFFLSPEQFRFWENLQKRDILEEAEHDLPASWEIWWEQWVEWGLLLEG